MSDRGGRWAHMGLSFRLAFDVLRAHKLRSGLVILGVAIGVTVLMGMVAVLSGLGKKIERDVTSSEKPVVTVSKFDFLTSGPNDERVTDRPDITPEDAIALESLCESAELADFFIDATPDKSQILQFRDQRSRMVFVAGGGTNFPYVYSFAIKAGRYFNDSEVGRSANVICLGYGPADDLFPQVDPVGKEIRVGEDEYEVVGVFDERKSIFGGMSENFAVIPWTTFRKNLGSKGDPYYVFMTVKPGRTPDQLVEEARAAMRARHGLHAGQKDDFDIISDDKINEFVKRITGPIGIALLILSSIGLTVGGIGVMNIMLVSVTERTREIGIRKALGARREVILTQFLIEAGLLTGIGGVIGVALGSLLAYGIGRAADFPAQVHPLVALGGMVFSAGIGIFFGIMPASRAARLDPIEALRYE
ncbi:MAG TPA: ABC transporter permease [bacterium]|nr:ABC transporter permease [bacterium]